MYHVINVYHVYAQDIWKVSIEAANGDTYEVSARAKEDAYEMASLILKNLRGE